METQSKVIDMHVHLWRHSVRNDEQVLRAMLDRYPISWLGVLPLWGGHHPSVAEIRAGNAAAAEFCRTDPRRLKPFVTVNPRHANSCEEIRRGYTEDGAIAVKVWVATLADQSLSDPLARECLRHDIPILFHAFHKSVGQLSHETDAQHVAALARRFPDLKIIMAHLAGNHLWGCAHIADCPNVWSDFSGTYCESGTIQHAVKMLGERRVLFGSDAPGADFVNNWAKVEETNLTPAQKRLITHDNAAALFGVS